MMGMEIIPLQLNGPSQLLMTPNRYLNIIYLQALPNDRRQYCYRHRRRYSMKWVTCSPYTNMPW